MFRGGEKIYLQQQADAASRVAAFEKRERERREKHQQWLLEAKKNEATIKAYQQAFSLVTEAREYLKQYITAIAQADQDLLVVFSENMSDVIDACDNAVNTRVLLEESAYAVAFDEFVRTEFSDIAPYEISTLTRFLLEKIQARRDELSRAVYESSHGLSHIAAPQTLRRVTRPVTTDEPIALVIEDQAKLFEAVIAQCQARLSSEVLSAIENIETEKQARDCYIMLWGIKNHKIHLSYGTASFNGTCFNAIGQVNAILRELIRTVQPSPLQQMRERFGNIHRDLSSWSDKLNGLIGQISDKMDKLKADADALAKQIDELVDEASYVLRGCADKPPETEEDLQFTLDIIGNLFTDLQNLKKKETDAFHARLIEETLAKLGQAKNELPIILRENLMGKEYAEHLSDDDLHEKTITSSAPSPTSRHATASQDEVCHDPPTIKWLFFTRDPEQLPLATIDFTGISVAPEELVHYQDKHHQPPKLTSQCGGSFTFHITRSGYGQAQMVKETVPNREYQWKTMISMVMTVINTCPEEIEVTGRADLVEVALQLISAIQTVIDMDQAYYQHYRPIIKSHAGRLNPKIKQQIDQFMSPIKQQLIAEGRLSGLMKTMTDNAKVRTTRRLAR